MSLLNYFSIETINLTATNGRTRETAALTYGPFALCHNLNGVLSVCHIESGSCIAPVQNLETGIRFIAFLNGIQGWDAITAGDVAIKALPIGLERSYRTACEHWRAMRAA